MPLSDFPELVRAHAGLIHKVARAYCRDATDREDVVQEICVQLWRAHGRYDGRHRPSTWIHRIALNTAISFHRRERRHRGPREGVEGLAVPMADTAEQDEQVALLWRCLDDLGPLDKALVLLWLEGHDHATTAGVLGLSTSNVGTRLARIKDRLRVAFAARGGTQGTA